MQIKSDVVIRPPDFFGLFSTEPDLAGGFTNVAPFVRSQDRDVDVHVFWRDHLDENGAFKPSQQIRELYRSKGVLPDKTVIAMCHGGYRSASTFLALKSLGYPHVRNYVSSWGEWGNRDDSRVVIAGIDR